MKNQSFHFIYGNRIWSLPKWLHHLPGKTAKCARRNKSIELCRVALPTAECFFGLLFWNCLAGRLSPCRCCFSVDEERLLLNGSADKCLYLLSDYFCVWMVKGAVCNYIFMAHWRWPHVWYGMCLTSLFIRIVQRLSSFQHHFWVSAVKIPSITSFSINYVFAFFRYKYKSVSFMCVIGIALYSVRQNICVYISTI